MNLALVIAFVVLLFILGLVSYVERVYTERGKFLSREFEENIEAFEQEVEPRLKMSRERAALSVAVLEQLSTAAHRHAGRVQRLSRPATGPPPRSRRPRSRVVLIVVVFNRLLPFVLFSRTRGAWLARFTIPLRVLLYLAMPVTLAIGFCISVFALTREHAEPEPERPSEAVDALIEAGQEEGILRGERPRAHPVGGRVRRQDGARGDEAASGDVRRARRHHRREAHRHAAHAAVLARAGVSKAPSTRSSASCTPATCSR